MRPQLEAGENGAFGKSALSKALPGAVGAHANTHTPHGSDRAVKIWHAPLSHAFQGDEFVLAMCSRESAQSVAASHARSTAELERLSTLL